MTSWIFKTWLKNSNFSLKIVEIDWMEYENFSNVSLVKFDPFTFTVWNDELGQ